MVAGMAPENGWTATNEKAAESLKDRDDWQRTGASLSDQAYRKVMDMIVNRRLTGGEILIESRLAGTLELTRTPLREALVRLEGEGLLVKQTNRSFSVRNVGVAEFFQSLKVRQYLEAKAAALAVGKVTARDVAALERRVNRLAKAKSHTPEHWKIDDDLHNFLAEASGNAVLAQTIRRLRITTQLFEIGRPFHRLQADAKEHLAILQAVKGGKAAAAQKTVFDHLKMIEKDVLQIVSSG
jgi:DNA-binding GntR family transcriptional regulator